MKLKELIADTYSEAYGSTGISGLDDVLKEVRDLSFIEGVEWTKTALQNKVQIQIAECEKQSASGSMLMGYQAFAEMIKSIGEEEV